MRPATAGRMHDKTSLALWGLGALALILAWRRLGSHVLNVVTYTLTPAPEGDPLVWMAGPTVFVAAVVLLARRRGAAADEGQPASAAWTARRAALPLLAVVAVSVAWHYGLGLRFSLVAVLVIAAGWAIDRLGGGVWVITPKRRADRLAPAFLALAVIIATAWHSAAQVGFWRHFMLGYADFGFFTTELEHCLPYKDAADRFADTRMGYHCVPFFYVLTPFYALFRSPVFLMVVGPLALNLAALAFYDLAYRRSGLRIVGLLAGLSWLLLPSISRLPYANTYGFQSIYLAVPWLAFALDFGLTGRWTKSHVCLGLALLCEETVCGVAVGWGLYLVLFGGRRRDGAIIVAAALAYLALATLVIIPHFATEQSYTRVHLFGAMTPAEAVARLLRPRAGLYLLALGAPLVVWLVRAPRLLVAAGPTLLLVLLMQNPDWLNVKYWHQSSVLPVLFAAAVVGATASKVREDYTPKQSRDRKEAGGWRGPRPALLRVVAPQAAGSMLGMFIAVLLMHQALGYSPISRAYALRVGGGALVGDDPRLAVVRRLRASIPRDRTILATERLAAHFTDYRGVYAGRATGPVDYVLIDRNDAWDTSGLGQRVDDYLRNGGCRLDEESAGIVVLNCGEADGSFK